MQSLTQQLIDLREYFSSDYTIRDYSEYGLSDPDRKSVSPLFM